MTLVPQRLRPTLARFWGWLPTSADATVRRLAWITLVGQLALVGTGGAVRLTDSGLGCPTWPECSPGSIVTTPAMGIHGVIEFGNRLLTVVIVIIVVAAFLCILRIRRERKDLYWLTLSIGLSIPLQAVIGGVSVLTKLDPYVVGLHFVVSVALVVASTVFVWRASYGPRGSERALLGWRVALVYGATFFAGVTILAGILTTGSGPHAGDAAAPRNGLDPHVLQHVHSWPAYVLLALTIGIVATTVRVRAVRAFAIALLIVELVQVAVGVTQARIGLPVLLVGIHLVLACVLASAMTALVLSLRLARRLEP